MRQRAGVAPTRFNARAATVQQRKQRSWNPPREPVNILYGRARSARRREERVPRGCRRLVNQGRAGGSATMPRSSARDTDPPPVLRPLRERICARRRINRQAEAPRSPGHRNVTVTKCSAEKHHTEDGTVRFLLLSLLDTQARESFPFTEA